MKCQNILILFISFYHSSLIYFYYFQIRPLILSLCIGLHVTQCLEGEILVNVCIRVLYLFPNNTGNIVQLINYIF